MNKEMNNDFNEYLLNKNLFFEFIFLLATSVGIFCFFRFTHIVSGEERNDYLCCFLRY